MTYKRADVVRSARSNVADQASGAVGYEAGGGTRRDRIEQASPQNGDFAKLDAPSLLTR
jgi:hypothetical protein